MLKGSMDIRSTLRGEKNLRTELEGSIKLRTNLKGSFGVEFTPEIEPVVDVAGIFETTTKLQAVGVIIGDATGSLEATTKLEAAGDVLDDASGGFKATTKLDATGDIYKYVLEFDGENDYVNINTISYQDGEEWTWSAWILLEKGYEGSADFQFVTQTSARGICFRPEFSTIVVYRDEDGNYYYLTDIDLGVWKHIVFVADGDGGMTLYIDGEEAASETDVNTENYFNHVLGGSAHPYRFSGRGSDVRVYSKALTDEEVLDLYNGEDVDDTGLEGHWPMDEGEGETAYDLSGNENDGSLIGPPDWRKRILEGSE